MVWCGVAWFRSDPLCSHVQRAYEHSDTHARTHARPHTNAHTCTGSIAINTGNNLQSLGMHNLEKEEIKKAAAEGRQIDEHVIILHHTRARVRVSVQAHANTHSTIILFLPPHRFSHSSCTRFRAAINRGNKESYISGSQPAPGGSGSEIVVF